MNIQSKRKNMGESICGTIRAKIMNGDFNPGAPLASNKELAEEFGVSALTADKAVRVLVEEGLVYREQGRGTFVSNAAPHKKKHSRIRIGLAASDSISENPLMAAALNIFSNTSTSILRSAGHEVLSFGYSEVRDAAQLAAATKDIDAMIVSSAYIDAITVKNLSTLKIPIVVDRTEKILDLPFSQIVVDHTRGTAEAAQLAVKSGAEEIIIVNEKHAHGELRRNLFKKALLEAGWQENKISTLQPDEWALQNGIASYKLGQKLAKTIRGKLLFSTSDVVTFAMLEAFSENALQPGVDFQLVSDDNLEDYGYTPGEKKILTTIDSKKMVEANRAASLILELIENKRDESIIVRIPTSLIIRKTAFNQTYKGENA